MIVFMKHRLPLIFLLLIFMASCNFLMAQDSKVFSGEPQNFAGELAVFMQKNSTAASDKALSDFMQAWSKDSLFSKKEQEHIIASSILLVKRNGHPYPHFTHYLASLVTLKRKNTSPENYQNWEKGLDLLLEKRKVSLMNTDRYLVFTTQFLDSSSLYMSGSVNWKLNSSNYRFVIDSAIHIVVPATSLVCYAKRDSMAIFETSGEFNPITSVWKGKNGLVTWERAGFKRNDVNAKLSTYEINMTRSEYSASQVVFTNTIYLSNPLKGNLIDKVQLNRRPEDADYPQFNSYQKDFKIKNLYKDINYEGGLSMQGAKMVGTGTRETQAKVYIFRKDTLVIIARSSFFAFKTGRIDAPNAEIVIKLKNDSIFHPGLALTYLVPNRELTLYRTDNYSSQSPYFDSYHKIDMSFEQLVWKMNEPLMHFTALMGSTVANANFESVNFFNNSKYLSLQLMDEVHPLISIRSFARYMGMEQFLADDFAAYLNKSIAQVKQLLMRMAAQGFIYYESETGMATIRPRLHDYLAASVSKIDYDVISIPSTTNMPVDNAIFDLRNYNLTINGVSRIFLSDSQNVAIYPANARIIMKKNRDFQFNGHVQAGLFTFSGQNFFFSYDTFKINMTKIDSLQIRYLTGANDSYGFPVSEKAKNLIEDLKGDLYVDKPDNKSGRNNFAEYPIFQSKANGHVYYDDKTIQSGIYSRDKFFYQIYPFEMDSLDNFNRKSMQFNGELTSAGIFPVIQETLRLQPDNSLGFHHMAPDSGITVYGGKGTFKNDIILNRSGLTGKGTLDYLTSMVASEDLRFYPDSMNAMARDFTITEKTSPTEYPRVESVHDSIHWMPYLDELYAYRTDTTFKMFDNKGVLAGDLKLQPTGLSGKGRMFFEGAEMRSDHYVYQSKDIHADSSDFYLKSLHSEGFTVLTENIKADINFNEHKGIFNSNEDYTLVSFPENKYVSFLDHFEWDMGKKELAMGSLNNVPPAVDTTQEGFTGPRYISIDPAQDSMSFISPVAFYDYDSNLIKATLVQYIDIADARIYPDNQRLTVMPDARLRTLYKAGLMASRENNNFSMHDAVLTITGKNRYTGSGYYEYIDEAEQHQTLFFSTLGVDTSRQSIGSGEVAETDNFTLSPNYRYQGRFYMKANRKLLTFDGGALIEQNCDRLPPRWVYFKSEIDPADIMIPIADPLIDINRDKIFNGMFMYYDSVHVYPAFLSGRKNYSDGPVVTAGGFLHYDKDKQEYVIAQKDKLADRNTPGNLVSLHRENCELYGEGKLSFGEKLGQVKLTAAGNVTHNTVTNETIMDILMGMDFFVEDNIMAVMSSEADSMPRLPSVDLNRASYTKNMVELMGKEKYNAMKSDLNLFGARTLPPEMKHTLVFNELKLKWNNETNSWRSVGKIGIASINNVPVNKRVDGLIELQIKRSGDIMDIYLQFDRRTWYYFGYTRGVMQIHSSNNTFLDKIQKLKTADRRMKVATGESYIYMVSTDVKKNSFLKKFREVTEAAQAPAENP
jgi:hypothetical protein